MPTYAWILIWAVVLVAVAFFAVREVRAGRKGPGEFDRMEHEASREAGVRSDIRGPNTFGDFGN